MNTNPPTYGTLPHDLEAEAAVLGALILCGPGETFGAIMAAVDGRDFYKPAHGAVFNAISDLYAHGQPIELISIKAWLEDRGELEQAGSIDGLLALADGTPGGGLSGPVYAARVHDLARLRRLIDAAWRIGQDAQDNPSDAPAVIARAEELVFTIGQERDRRGAVRAGDGIAVDFERLERGEALVSGLPTGIPGADRMVAMTPGSLNILAARPSIGKTSLALNIAQHWTITLGKPVLVFSLEMNRAELRVRLLSALAGIDGQRLRDGEQFRGAALANLQQAGEKLRAAPLFIDDARGLSIGDVRARARREMARHGLAAVVVDYLQLLSAPGRENRTQEITTISAGLKQLAGELEVPVLALSQLNRLLEQREDHRPRLSDLRDSGSIEQDADTVLMLHREDYYRKPHEQRDGRAELNVAKNRNGRVGTVELSFDPGTTTFSTEGNP